MKSRDGMKLRFFSDSAGIETRRPGRSRCRIQMALVVGSGQARAQIHAAWQLGQDARLGRKAVVAVGPAGRAASRS